MCIVCSPALRDVITVKIVFTIHEILLKLVTVDYIDVIV